MEGWSLLLPVHPTAVSANTCYQTLLEYSRTYLNHANTVCASCPSLAALVKRCANRVLVSSAQEVDGGAQAEQVAFEAKARDDTDGERRDDRVVAYRLVLRAFHVLARVYI